jgi:hypothetical protein
MGPLNVLEQLPTRIDGPTIGIISVVLLSLFLYYRTIGRHPRPIRFQDRPAGTGIDTSPIAAKVAAVRDNPIVAFETKAIRKSRRSMLIAAARGAIRGLSFFRTREHEHGT